MKRVAPSPTLRRVACARLPTRWGMFQAIGFQRVKHDSKTDTGLALLLGDHSEEALPLRMHSQCFTGDVLGSLRCDCGEQFAIAMRTIAAEGRGIIIYEHQEGRGIGLMAKLKAYALQDRGLDTIEANHALGFAADCRDFGLTVAVLHDLGIKRVRLLSNNPQKIHTLIEGGIEVVEQIPCEAEPNPHALCYLRTKKEKMGHRLTLL